MGADERCACAKHFYYWYDIEPFFVTREKMARIANTHLRFLRCIEKVRRINASCFFYLLRLFVKRQNEAVL